MIRPFQVGDIFLMQSLSRQATWLNSYQALLQPYSVIGAALTAIVPWNDAKVTTYVLNQRGHDLARSGFLQVQKRAGRPEADILLLAPALDTPRGHPAIWEKLLSHYLSVVTTQQVMRIYVDVPDQPLLVNTFSHVGFRAYTRQTIWRLSPSRLESFANDCSDQVRLQVNEDAWGLRRLYSLVTPQHVQQAEGQQVHEALDPPILAGWQAFARQSYVLVRASEILGCLRISYGMRGIWLQLWSDMQQVDSQCIHHLLRHALTEIRRQGGRQPIYIGVRDYHGALGTILSDYGFAPFTDRAKMVKHVVQWVKSKESVLMPALESVPEAVPAPFTLHE